MLVEQEPKFGQIIHKTKCTYYNTATPRFHWNKSLGIWSNYTQDKVYILQHLATPRLHGTLEPKFGQMYTLTKCTYYNTATPRFHWSSCEPKFGQIIHKTKSGILQHSYSKAVLEHEPKFGHNYDTRQSLLLPTPWSSCVPSSIEPKFGQIIHKTKSTYYNWSYSKAPVEHEPKFGQIIHKTKSTYYNTWSTPRTLSSVTRAKIWSNYTHVDKVYILQQSYSWLQWNKSQNLVKCTL